MSKKGGPRMAVLESKPSAADLAVVKAMLEAGTVTPVIDRTFTLGQVPDAIRHLEQGHPRGKVVVAVGA